MSIKPMPGPHVATATIKVGHTGTTHSCSLSVPADQGRPIPVVATRLDRVRAEEKNAPVRIELHEDEARKLGLALLRESLEKQSVSAADLVRFIDGQTK